MPVKVSFVITAIDYILNIFK